MRIALFSRLFHRRRLRPCELQEIHEGLSDHLKDSCLASATHPWWLPLSRKPRILATASSMQRLSRITAAADLIVAADRQPRFSSRLERGQIRLSGSPVYRRTG
jgi:hypothetical protein